VARAAERRRTPVLTVSSSDLVNELEVQDRISAGRTRLVWRLGDVRLDGAAVTGVHNRLDDLDFGAFGVPTSSAAFAWRELRAYLIFALSSFPRVVNPPEGQALSGRGESASRQWRRLKAGISCPRWWFGRPAELPAWARRPGRRLATSDPWEPPCWRPVDLDAVPGTGLRLFYEIPPGHPIDVWLVGGELWVHSPYVRLPDDVTLRIRSVVERARGTSRHVMARARFFYTSTPPLLSFGHLSPTTTLAGIPASLTEQVESSLVSVLGAQAGGPRGLRSGLPRAAAAADSAPTIFPSGALLEPVGAISVPRRHAPPPTVARVHLIAADADPTARHFAAYARRLGRAMAWWRTEDLLEHGAALLSTIDAGKQDIGFYLRRPGTPDQRLEDTLALVDEALQHHPGPVVGAGADRGSNHSKPLHAATLTRLPGPRRIPDTAVRSVVQGSTGGPPTIVKAISTQKVQVLRLPDPIGTGPRRYVAPVQMQPLVSGRNVRVHVVVDRVHALAVSSSALDYRFDQRFSVTPEELAPELATWCVMAARSESVRFAGIDLIVADERTWCLEVNPSPGYHVFEERLDQAGGRSPLSGWLLAHLLDGDR
jgi:hypothetical protein